MASATIRGFASLFLLTLCALFVLNGQMSMELSGGREAKREARLSAAVEALRTKELSKLKGIAKKLSEASGAGGGKAPGLKGGSGRPRGAASRYDAELDYDFAGTAIVTMAAGNAAIRGAIALMGSLRDSGTRAETLLVLLSRGGEGSPECRLEDGGAWARANGRERPVDSPRECTGPDTVEEEIASPQYLRTLREKLRVELTVVDPIPSTAYTEGIPGGRSTFWGMALNKMRVYNMTQYKKVLWMDADTIVFKNMDHLFKEPSFTTGASSGGGAAGGLHTRVHCRSWAWIN